MERTITTDSITGQRDTTYQVLPQELVWQSDGLDINDSVAVVNAVKARRTRKSPARGPKEQEGQLMEYFQGFTYYVFSFNYPSIDAEGNELTLSAMAACPLKSGTSEVRNVILGTHLTITADRERPTSHFSGFGPDDWGMMFSMAAGPKFILTGDLQAALVAANLASYFILNLYLPGVGFLLSGLITAYQIGQIAKAAGNYEYNYNLVIMPDYGGYGASKDRAHPYLYQELTARHCLDATRYGIELYKTDASLKYISIPLRSEFRTISCGYSQGGSVAMACHRFAEQNNLASELHYAGSICGDGPYDPVATLMYYVSQEKEKKPMSMPVVLPLIVKGMLDTNPYMQSHKAEDYFNSKSLEPVTIDRAAPGNPFYKLDERTILYFPEGKAAGGKNVVVGAECQSITITDKWDFRPPYGFHADEAEYSRIFYATKLADGSYQSYAYTFCIPFGVSEDDWTEADPSGSAAIYAMQYVNTTANRAFVFSAHPGQLGGSLYPQAGLPYILVVREGQVQLKAHNTWLTAAAESHDYRVKEYRRTNHVMGDFKGTFARISNEHAAAANAYSMNKGRWCRIRNDEGSLRGAYVDAFRAYFVPEQPLPFNTYATDYVAEPQGFASDFYSFFPADEFTADSDFSGYDLDDETGINSLTFNPSPKGEGSLEGEGSGEWFTLDGRRISRPSVPGLYLNRGKKVMVK